MVRIQLKTVTYKLSTACIDMNNAGTLNVSKNICGKIVSKEKWVHHGNILESHLKLEDFHFRPYWID